MNVVMGIVSIIVRKPSIVVVAIVTIETCSMHVIADVEVGTTSTLIVVSLTGKTMLLAIFVAREAMLVAVSVTEIYP